MEGFQRYQMFNQIVIIGSLYDNLQQSGAVFALPGWLTGGKIIELIQKLLNSI